METWLLPLRSVQPLTRPARLGRSQFGSLASTPSAKRMPLADGSDLSVTPVDRALPLEMLDLIGRQCDVQTLSRLSQTSQAMLSWFGPILLRHIVILPKKTDKLPTWLVPRIYALFGHRVSELVRPRHRSHH